MDGGRQSHLATPQRVPRSAYATECLCPHLLFPCVMLGGNAMAYLSLVLTSWRRPGPRLSLTVLWQLLGPGSHKEAQGA